MKKKHQVESSKEGIIKKMRELKKDLQKGRFDIAERKHNKKESRKMIKKQIAQRATALNTMKQTKRENLQKTRK